MDLGLGLGIASLIATAIIGGLSFYLTYKTSAAAARETAEMSKAISAAQIRASANAKIAEFRMEWINGFRLDLAALSRVNLELIRLRRHGTKKDQDSTDLLSAKRSEGAELRSRLLLRLKPASDDKEELELETLLRRSIEVNLEQADENRKKIVSLSRKLLKREWEKVKTETLLAEQGAN
jgi:hypothetical protein